MCFTPQVTATTSVLEFVFAAWTWSKYRMTELGRLVAGILLLLGLYQFTELMICVGNGEANIWWGRLGFSLIAFLPAMGVHAASLIEQGIRGKKQKRSLVTAITPYGYLIAALLTTFLFFTSSAISSAMCAPFYIIYEHASLFYLLYGTYYATFVTLGFVYFVSLLNQVRGSKQSACLWLCIGYLSFVVPTFITTAIFPFMNIGFPSVLCGFAIFLALILVVKVLPLYYLSNKSIK